MTARRATRAKTAAEHGRGYEERGNWHWGAARTGGRPSPVTPYSERGETCEPRSQHELHAAAGRHDQCEEEGESQACPGSQQWRRDHYAPEMSQDLYGRCHDGQDDQVRKGRTCQPFSNLSRELADAIGPERGVRGARRATSGAATPSPQGKGSSGRRPRAGQLCGPALAGSSTMNRPTKKPQQRPVAKYRTAVGRSAGLSTGRRHQRAGRWRRAANTVATTPHGTQRHCGYDSNANGTRVTKTKDPNGPGRSRAPIMRSSRARPVRPRRS